jgi:hypothetical protein
MMAHDWRTAEPTDKQVKCIARIAEHCSWEKVTAYLKKYYPSVTLETMNRVQANKIITGLSYVLPTPVIHGIYCPWSLINS